MTDDGKRGFRGSGVRHTLPHLGRYSGLWLLVSVVAVVVASVSTYLLFGQEGPVDRSAVTILVFQTLLLIAALVGLAVFTTHRLAGPWIAVRRALQSLREGDLDTFLSLRTADEHLKEVEREFNRMVERMRDEKRD